MNCVVTGGAGFIGSNIAEALITRGDRVTVLDNLSTGKRENIHPFFRHAGFRFIEGSITDPDACAEAVKGSDAVFHHAAFVSVPGSLADPAGTAQTNVAGTVNVFEAARQAGVRAVVWASSTAVYGDSEALPNIESMPLCPLSPYAASKAAGEQFARAYASTWNMNIISLRYFNVYGPRQDPASPYSAAIPLFISRMLSGLRTTIYGDGEQTRDFIHVDDVVRANLLAADARPGSAGCAFNIGGGKRISVNRLHSLIAESLGVSAEPVYAPARSGEVRDSVACIDAAREAFGFVPVVGIEDGIQRTVDWYRDTVTSGGGR
jgi:UDP-glucose 4-epimerase